VPPTERKGRVHTSTVTVAVLDPREIKQVEFNDRDFRIEWYSGTGCGGQNRNKVKSSCRLTHVPTGVVQTAQTRSRENSYKLALEGIKKLILEISKMQNIKETSLAVREMTGTGMRGDKIRTYRFQDDKTIDHLTGKSARTSDVMRGNFQLLW
jgi:peptide chain release factor 1